MDQRELDIQQEVELGHRASELYLGLVPYFETMETQLLTGIKQCAVADVDTLHNIKLQLHALEKLQENIKSVINTGKMASVELEEIDKWKQKQKSA